MTAREKQTEHKMRIQLKTKILREIKVRILEVSHKINLKIRVLMLNLTEE